LAQGVAASVSARAGMTDNDFSSKRPVNLPEMESAKIGNEFLKGTSIFHFFGKKMFSTVHNV